MITFTEFSNRLALGQLKNTSAVDSEISPGVIQASKIPEIISYTNQGLTDLATRQTIITKMVDLTFVNGQNSYVMDPDATYLDTSETEDFTGKYIKTLDIMDSDGCQHLTDVDGHIMTPSYNTLRFTASKMEKLGTKVRVRYQSTHDEITEASDISIPPNLEIALQLFVASLYLTHINSEESIAKGNSYFGTYLRHLGLDQDRDLSSTSEVEEDTRLDDRGFV